MIHGMNDYLYGKRSQQLFDLFATPPEHKRLALVEGGHIPGEEVVREILDWLDRYLGPVGSSADRLDITPQWKPFQVHDTIGARQKMISAAALAPSDGCRSCPSGSARPEIPSQ
jgi:hypothetical protein